MPTAARGRPYAGRHSTGGAPGGDGRDEPAYPLPVDVEDGPRLRHRRPVAGMGAQVVAEGDRAPSTESRRWRASPGC